MSVDPPIVYDFDPRNLPDDLLRAVGLVVAASAQTESTLQAFIGGLLQIDEIEAIALGAQMSNALRDQVAWALIELNAVNATIVHRVDALHDGITEAAKKRNIIVHNSFTRHPDTGVIYSMRASARGSLQVRLQPITADEIEQEARLIYESGMELYRFMLAFDLVPRDRTRPVPVALKRGRNARENVPKGRHQPR